MRIQRPKRDRQPVEAVPVGTLVRKQEAGHMQVVHKTDHTDSVDAAVRKDSTASAKQRVHRRPQEVAVAAAEADYHREVLRTVEEAVAPAVRVPHTVEEERRTVEQAEDHHHKKPGALGGPQAAAERPRDRMAPGVALSEDLLLLLLPGVLLQKDFQDLLLEAEPPKAFPELRQMDWRFLWEEVVAVVVAAAAAPVVAAPFQDNRLELLEEEPVVHIQQKDLQLLVVVAAAEAHRRDSVHKLLALEPRTEKDLRN